MFESWVIVASSRTVAGSSAASYSERRGVGGGGVGGGGRGRLAGRGRRRSLRHGGGGGGVGGESVAHGEHLAEVRRRVGGVLVLGAVDHRAECGLCARRVVGEQALGEVREGLRDDGVVLVGGEADPLEGGEGARDVEDVRRHLEELAVALPHLLHHILHVHHAR